MNPEDDSVDAVLFGPLKTEAGAPYKPGPFPLMPRGRVRGDSRVGGTGAVYPSLIRCLGHEKGGGRWSRCTGWQSEYRPASGS